MFTRPYTLFWKKYLSMIICETQIQIKFNIRPSGILKPHLNWHLFVCRTFAFWKVKTLDFRFKSYFPEKLSICTLISLFCILVILNVWIAQSYLSKELKGNKIFQTKSNISKGNTQGVQLPECSHQPLLASSIFQIAFRRSGEVQ